MYFEVLENVFLTRYMTFLRCEEFKNWVKQTLSLVITNISFFVAFTSLVSYTRCTLIYHVKD